VVARSLALRSSDLIGPDCLPGHIVHNEKDFLARHLGTKTNVNEVVRDWSRRLLKVILSKGNIDLAELKETMERESTWAVRRVIEETLAKTGNNRTKAAKLLNVTPRVLRYLEKEKDK